VSGYTVVVNRVGGYVLFISSILALYVGTALMVANETGT
jgi:succinate-acetate transporter protein